MSSPHGDNVPPEVPAERSPDVREVLSHQRLHLGAQHVRPGKLEGGGGAT